LLDFVGIFRNISLAKVVLIKFRNGQDAHSTKITFSVEQASCLFLNEKVDMQV